MCCTTLNCSHTSQALCVYGVRCEPTTIQSSCQTVSHKLCGFLYLIYRTAWCALGALRPRASRSRHGARAAEPRAGFASARSGLGCGAYASRADFSNFVGYRTRLSTCCQTGDTCCRVQSGTSTTSPVAATSCTIQLLLKCYILSRGRANTGPKFFSFLHFSE